MNNDQLINKKFHILQRNKIHCNNNIFIFEEVGKRINESLDNINFAFNEIIEIGLQTNIFQNYVKLRFPKSNFYLSDISNNILDKSLSKNSKICFDHDKWPFEEKIFDLVVSNFYIHLSNNLDILLKKINLSLKNNGFFIATIPGSKMLIELKNCMIQADIEFYKGAYRRFADYYSLEYLNKIIKKNSYKMPVIDIDIIQLKYKKFSNLMRDIRYLGHSNNYFDRKTTFENKNYFKRVEEIYWEKYSNKDQLIAQLEIIYLSGWKND